MDKVRVLRIYEFIGDRPAIERQIANSIQGEKSFTTKEGWSCTIRAATLGTFPEVLEERLLMWVKPKDSLEEAYLAILNLSAHGTPIPADVRDAAETYIGEKELRS